MGCVCVCVFDVEGQIVYLIFLNLLFVEVWLIYNVVLISAIQQSGSVIHIYIFFFILVYPRIFNIVPCAIQ